MDSAGQREQAAAGRLERRPGASVIPQFHRRLEWHVQRLVGAGLALDRLGEVPTRRRAPAWVPMFCASEE